MGKSWKVIEDRIWKQTYFRYDDKYIKAKIKIYADSTITNFITNKCLRKKQHVIVYL